MTRKIILCSDGTGNKGGSTPDTNVFRLYNAIDHAELNQVSFYDNGVGTASNKYIRAITGAFGFGFNANVMDLYEFLARHYEQNATIYMFGFSRGAATIRAFAGMLQVVGLLDRTSDACTTAGDLDEQKFQEMLKKARSAYIRHRKDPYEAESFREHCVKNGNGEEPWRIKIEFIGVWDTVSALGFPLDWSSAVSWLFEGLDYWSDCVFPHNYYEYQLDGCVECACHALALDDERKTFHPRVWWEKASPDRSRGEKHPENLHQVWFSGVHSNVGGGYERAGMASVALHWMMCWAARHGVKFDSGAIDDALHAANVTDKLYDSRDGTAIYYRYAPREINKLWGDRFDGRVKIHESVDERIREGTARYAPGFLPHEIEIVETPDPDSSTPIPLPIEKLTAKDEETWRENRSEIDKWVGSRKRLYTYFVEATLLLVLAVVWLANFPVASAFPNTDVATGFHPVIAFLHHMADWLGAVLPDFLGPFIGYVFVVQPWTFAALLLLVAAFAYFKYRNRKGNLLANEKARHDYLASDLASYRGRTQGEAEPQSSEGNSLAERKAPPGGPPHASVPPLVSRLLSLGVWVLLIFASIYFLFTYRESERVCGDLAEVATRTPVNVGDKETVDLLAGDYWNASGVILKKDAVYSIAYERPPGSVWKDSSRATDPGQGWWPERENEAFTYYFTELLDFTLRAEGEKLFVPIGLIRGACLGGWICERQFRIEPAGTSVTAPADGEFCAYANDLPFMFWNNSGRLKLAITRTN